MGLLCGKWLFNDEAGTSAFASFPIPADADGSSKTTFFDGKGPRLLARGFAAVEMCTLPVQAVGQGESSWIVWDGRLDNRPELAQALEITLPPERQDIELVAAAFAKWRTNAFAKLRGDWAVTIWNHRDRSLILAKDPMGTRPLFYTLTSNRVTWSSSLQWLVQDAKTSLELNFEYVAGWLSFFPAAHLTPFCEIRAVPPSCFVQIRAGRETVRKYWEFQPTEPISYKSDFEYEEHFRAAFTNAIRRRLRSTRPLLAELSGGMDSSSIVCIADALLAHEQGLTPRLDTLSYYDDDEPNWNERSFFTLVEAKRGREGLHVQLDSSESLAALIEHQGPVAAPAEIGKTSNTRAKVAGYIQSQLYGGILSGIGGDEFTGGVPTPIPELADLLVAGRLRLLAHQLKLWSLSQRRPWMHVLWDTLKSFAPSFLGTASHRPPPSWLVPQFERRYRSVLRGYDLPLRAWGPRPSFQENLSAVEALRRQLAASNVGSQEAAEKSYPYLDADLLGFLFALPRPQLVEPGRRRSLMRRALGGIVPVEILARKRKAYVARGPLTAIAARWTDLESLTPTMVADSFGIVLSGPFRQALQKAREGKETAVMPILRTLSLEFWLRNLVEHSVLCPRSPAEEQQSRPATASAPLHTHYEKVSAS
jgi:asparagine synthase (glutamine-hydrolysing)